MSQYPTRRNTNRISQHDYSKPGYYFITICTENRKQLFGTIENNEMASNDVGRMINSWWNEIVNHFANIELAKPYPWNNKYCRGGVTPPG